MLSFMFLRAGSTAKLIMVTTTIFTLLIITEKGPV